LARIPGVGKAWSYGQTYYLDLYTREVCRLQSADIDEIHELSGTAELKELEAILTRKHDANVFIVGDDIEAKLEIIARLQSMIEQGTAYPELEHKRIVVFDTDIFTSKNSIKGVFEVRVIESYD
jgi:ATP-dependent Clp protease ATP-binding subunit ClpA